MRYNYNKKLVKNAQILRKNMTVEEKKLWYQFLRRLPITVNRQKNIGNYIVDFFISSKKTVIELDGAQHDMEENKALDIERDRFLNSIGIMVLRYSNIHLNKNFNLVCDEILKHLGIGADELTDRQAY